MNMMPYKNYLQIIFFHQKTIQPGKRKGVSIRTRTFHAPLLNEENGKDGMKIPFTPFLQLRISSPNL
jgi:hypothetical protein